MNAYGLCPIFGVVPSSMYVWLHYGLEVMDKLVRTKSFSAMQVKWASITEMEASACLLQKNRPFGHVLHGIFGVTDGGRFPCSEFEKVDMQDAYYEGYTQSVEVTNIFAFNFFGEIIHAGVNYSGSWHHSRIATASRLYDRKLSYAVTRLSMEILCDSAFVNCGKAGIGKVVRKRRVNETSDLPESSSLAAVDNMLQIVLLKERQSAEWGIRSVKASFKRRTVPLPTDHLKRLRIIRICCHLLNFNTKNLGLTQIRSTYSQRLCTTCPIHTA